MHRCNGNVSTRRQRRVSHCGVAAGLILVAGLAGCAGKKHGTYTQEHLDKATARVAEIKSATEYDMAHQAYMGGDLKKALDRIDMSIAINDKVARSHVLRGRILIELGNFEGAIASLNRATELEPENVEAPYYRGIVFERLVQRDKALEQYLIAASLDGTNPQYIVAAAEMLIDLGRVGEAGQLLLNQSSTFEHNAGVRQTLGHIAMIEGRPVDAVAMFNEARLLAPDDQAIVEDLIRAQIAIREFAEAEYNLAKLLSDKANENRRDLVHLRARCLVEVDRPVEARELLVKLTAGDQGAADIEAWIGLGHVSYVLGDLHRVRTSAMRVIALDPVRHEGYLLKALYQRKKNEGAEALASVDQALALSAHQPLVLTLRGLILLEMGKDLAALDSLRMALVNDPGNDSVKRLVASLEEQPVFAAVSE